MIDACNWFRDNCLSFGIEPNYTIDKYTTECGINILVAKPYAKSFKKSGYVFCPNCSWPIMLKKTNKLSKRVWITI